MEQFSQEELRSLLDILIEYFELCYEVDTEGEVKAEKLMDKIESLLID